MNTTTLDQEQFALYGIVPGPIHDNHNRCEASDYVCSFECVDKVEGQWYEKMVDLYVFDNNGQQNYLLRDTGESESDYSSGPIDSLFSMRHKPFTQALHILVSFGSFRWSKR